jgi:hypothetical protein
VIENSIIIHKVFIDKQMKQMFTIGAIGAIIVESRRIIPE